MKKIYKVPVERIQTGNILILAENEDDALTIAREQLFSTNDIIDRDIYGEESWEIIQSATIEATDDYVNDECLNNE